MFHMVIQLFYMGFRSVLRLANKLVKPCGPKRIAWPWCLLSSLGVADPSLSHCYTVSLLVVSSHFGRFAFCLIKLVLRIGSFWTSTLFFFLPSTAFLSHPNPPPFLTFSSLHHTFQLWSSSLTPTLTCPYFALLISFAVLGNTQITRCLKRGFSH